MATSMLDSGHLLSLDPTFITLKDVDRLRLFSPRFLLAMAATCSLQALLWWLTIGVAMSGHGVFMPDGYLFGLGAMVLVQLTVHVRHLRNYILFRAVVAGDGISGRIEYRRPIMLRLSSVGTALVHASSTPLSSRSPRVGSSSAASSRAVRCR